MDKLSSFTNSDLKEDKGLFGIFEAAEFAHLLNDLIKAESENIKTKHNAGFVRKYLS